MMVQQWEATEIDIDGCTFWVSPVGAWVLESGNVVAQGLALSLDKPLEWAVGHGGPPHRCAVDAGAGLAGGWG